MKSLLSTFRVSTDHTCRHSSRVCEHETVLARCGVKAAPEITGSPSYVMELLFYHRPYPCIVWRSHTLSKTGEGLVYLASRTCALLPESGKSNQIAEKPIIAFHANVT